MRATTTLLTTVLLGTALLMGLLPSPAAGLHDRAGGPEVDPVPTLAIDPATDLVDGQTVTVTGSGYQPDEFVTVAECPAGVTNIFLCAEGKLLAQDASGNLDEPYRLNAVFTIYSPNRRTVDCRAEPCDLVAGTFDPDRFASVPLAFDPDAPLRPPLTVSVTPDDGLADGQTVTVVLSNFTPGGAVTVAQCADPEAFDNRSCRPGGSIDLVADENGAARTNLVVRDVYQTPIDGRIDCRVWECAVLAFDNRDEPLGADFGFADLTFADLPPAPPAPPPSPAPPAEAAAATPRFTG